MRLNLAPDLFHLVVAHCRTSAWLSLIAKHVNIPHAFARLIRCAIVLADACIILPILSVVQAGSFKNFLKELSR
jgi:hypothetical protein